MNDAAIPRTSDLMRVLADIEARFPVLDWRSSGIDVWPIARVRWFMTEWARFYVSQGAQSRSPVRRLADLGAAPLAAALAEFRAGIPRRDAPADVLFFSDGISLAHLGGAWVDRFCDPLIRIARNMGLTTALWMPTHDARWRRGVAARFVQPDIDRANLRAMLQGAPAGTRLEQGAELGRFLRTAGFSSAQIEPSSLSRLASRVRHIANAFLRRLKRVRPRFAFLVNYYSLEGMAFVLACREVGIPTADLQHGVQGELHPAYAAWPSGRQHALLPDVFWVWSDWERNVIEKWSAPGPHRAVAGGNPWLTVWAADSDFPGVAASRVVADELRARATGRPVVLVTLQYGFKPSEQLEPLERLLEASAGRLAFWIRLHPMMLEQRQAVHERFRRFRDCEIDAPSDLPLHVLLSRVDAHVTHSSSVVIEAAQFGVRSVITTTFGEELFEPMYASGFARTETGSPEKLCVAIDHAIAARSAGESQAEATARVFEELWKQAG